MLSEEEFTVFQNQLVEIGQENFKLKEELDNLQDKNAELPKLKSQIAECERQRDEMILRHKESVDVLHEELSKLQKQAEQQEESNNRRVSDQIAEVNKEIEEVQHQTKEKEEQLEQLRQQVKTHDASVQQKSKKLEQLREKAQKYIPIMKFLHNSRAIPMYIEDINSRIASLTAARNRDEKALNDLDQEVTGLHRENDELGRRIKEVSQEILETKNKLQDTQSKISSTNEEIIETQKTIDQTEAKLKEAKETTNRITEERDASLKSILEEKEKYKELIKQQESQKKELQTKIDALHAKTGEELEKYNKKIAKLRKKLNIIKETGMDDEVPRVDKELQQQINRIVEEKAALKDKGLMLKQATQLVQDEIRDKDLLIQTLTLKQPPTPRILAMPEFQQKQLLLEELVLQNRELKKTFSDMTEKIVAMKEEANKLREIIQEKSK